MNAQLKPAPTTVDMILTNNLFPDLDQPRKYFDPAALQELAADISVRGIMEPILYFIDDEDRNTILAGERRFRAAKLAGLDVVPCLLRDAPDAKERLMDQVSENFQREGLNPIEMALFFDALITRHKIKVGQVGDELVSYGLRKFERSYISNLRRLLQLPTWAQDMIQNGKLTGAHGKILLEGLKSDPVMDDLRVFLEKQKERPTVNEINYEINQAYRKHYRELRHWDAPFDTANLCKGCENSKNYPSDSRRFCMDDTCYDAHKTEAIKKADAAKAREDKRRQKQLEKMQQQQASELGCDVADLPPITTTESDDSRVSGRIERTQQYLDNYLRAQLLAHLPEDDATRYQVVLWMAGGAPGDYGYTGDYRGTAGNVDMELDVDYENLGVKLTLQNTFDQHQFELMICSKGIEAMDRENLRMLSHHCGITLDFCIVDREYLDIKIKQEIIDITPPDFIPVFERTAGDWEKRCKGSTNELKELILECAHDFGVPSDLPTLYHSEV